MRVLSWNIRQGDGTRIPEICRHIADTGPDLLVLSEFQTRNESQLRAALIEAGLPFVESSDPAPSRNGLLVASKWPLLESPSTAPDVDRERWLALRIGELDLDVLAVHIPGAPDSKFEDGYGISGAKRKELMWERILSYAAEHHDQRAMVVGDFNTGLRIDAEGAMFKKSHYMQSLIDTGFVDTWRHQHPQTRGYTWYTKRKDKHTGESADLNGFRLDYLFVSPPLRGAIGNAAILHAPRKAGASDHASVVLEPGRGATGCAVTGSRDPLRNNGMKSPTWVDKPPHRVARRRHLIATRSKRRSSRCSDALTATTETRSATRRPAGASSTPPASATSGQTASSNSAQPCAERATANIPEPRRRPATRTGSCVHCCTSETRCRTG